MRNHRPTANVPYRLATAADALPDFTVEDYGVRMPGGQRCHAIGLPTGDCRQAKEPDSEYCYYHDKLQLGLMEPSVPTAQSWGPAWTHDLDGIALYPVWPLPAEGYVLLEDAPDVLVVA